MSSTEDFVATPEKPLSKRNPEKKGSPVRKRAEPQHMLTEWICDKYPFLRFFATAPSDAARHPNKYSCRVCMVELSLKTKGPLEMLRHYRTDAHLVREHRIRMKTPGLTLFDKQSTELSGMVLKYARREPNRNTRLPPSSATITSVLTSKNCQKRRDQRIPTRKLCHNCPYSSSDYGMADIPHIEKNNFL